LFAEKTDPFPADDRGEGIFTLYTNVLYFGGKPTFRLNTVPSPKWPEEPLPPW
jgi:hypothetical protein